MVATLNESPRDTAVLLSEANGALSREVVPIAAGQTLEAGTVLGKVTSSGEYVQLDPAATDGSQTAAAVLLYAVETGANPGKATVIVRLAEVSAAALVWPAGITAAQKDSAVGQLAGAYIIAR